MPTVPRAVRPHIYYPMVSASAQCRLAKSELRNHAEFDIATVLDTRANVRTPALPPTILGDGAWRSIKVIGISLGVVSLCCASSPPRLHRRGRPLLQHRVL